jgi:hypothetical protein
MPIACIETRPATGSKAKFSARTIFDTLSIPFNTLNQKKCKKEYQLFKMIFP